MKQDPNQKNILEAYANFRSKLAELKTQQLDILRRFTERTANKKIEEVRKRLGL